jgi:hypothetical protein
MNKEPEDKPHEKRRGYLKNDNPPGDFSKAPRCLARTRKGTPCKAPAMKNGRCKLHGGKSTGPKTPEGIENIRKAHLKHGEYTIEAVTERREFRALLGMLRSSIKETEGEAHKVSFKLPRRSGKRVI